MKVVVATTSYPSATNEVSGVFVARLTRALVQLGITVDVLMPSGTEIAEHDEDERMAVKQFRYAPRSMEILAHRPGGIPVALSTNRFSYFLLPSFLVSFAIQLWKVARGADLIHANWSVIGLIGILVGQLTNCPVVTTLRGEDINRAEQSRIYAGILTFCVKYSCRIVVVSDPIYELVITKYPAYATKMIVIKNGVCIRQEKRDQEISNVEDLRLIVVGSLIPRKNVDVVIRAVSQVNGSGVVLNVVGDGELRSALESMAIESDISDRVYFLGQVAAEEVESHLLAADVFILASSFEGRSNALLEAMAYGLMPVVSDIEANTSVVTHNENGLVFQLNDVAHLANLIGYLKENRGEVLRLGHAAGRYAQAEFSSWEDCAAEYLQVFNEVISECAA